MTLLVKEDELSNPMSVGLFGAITVMARAMWRRTCSSNLGTVRFVPSEYVRVAASHGSVLGEFVRRPLLYEPTLALQSEKVMT